jgi:hypothetical protein
MTALHVCVCSYVLNDSPACSFMNRVRKRARGGHFNHLFASQRGPVVCGVHVIMLHVRLWSPTVSRERICCGGAEESAACSASRRLQR